MKIKSDEIVSLLKREIEDYAPQLEVDEVGSILEVGDGIARIFGLRNCMFAEMLEFPGDVFGIALNLEESSVGAVLLGDFTGLREGMQVKRTGKIMSIPTGEGMIGRVVNPLGEPIDDKGPIKSTHRRPMEIIAPGIAGRQPVTEPLQTGIKAVDAMIPIGRGQRELIIGDRSTGKTAVAIDTIINQRGKGVKCVYVAVGQKASTVANVVSQLRESGAMDYTCVVQASASDPAPMQYVAPYAGCAIAEYFMYEKGEATLVVYDDLTKQAAAYRELSLLLRRPPGREAYPGDVFYLHSRLLERSVKLKEDYIIVKKDSAKDTKEGVDGKVYDRPEGAEVAEFAIKGFDKEHHTIRKLGKGEAVAHEIGKWAITEKNSKTPFQHHVFDSESDAKKAFEGMKDSDKLEVRRKMPSGGSLTALPIIETQEGEVSAYIPTNVISITDGQIYLEPNLFFSGIRPAINVGISVSRVGGNAQTKAMKGVAKSLKLDLASYWDLEAFAQLGTELDAATKAKLERGKRMVELLKQGQYQPMSVEDQVMMIFAGNEGYLDQIDADKVADFEKKFLDYVHSTHSEIPESIAKSKKLDDASEKNLSGVLGDFVGHYQSGTAPDPRSQAKKDSGKKEAKKDEAKKADAKEAKKDDKKEDEKKD